MTHIVSIPFATPLRRFAEGDPVRSSDIDGPVPFERWVELGNLIPKPVEKKAKAAPETPPEPPATAG